jgi:hypothetical protein
LRWSGHDRKLAVRAILNDRLTSRLILPCQLSDEVVRFISRTPCQALGWLGGAGERWLRVSLITCTWLSAHVEFENSGYHDHGLRAVAVLEHGKFHGFGAIDEQTAAKAFLIPNDPVASAVPADHEER